MKKLTEQEKEIIIDLHIELAKTVIANYEGEIMDEARIEKMQMLTDKICYTLESSSQ